MTYHVSVNQKHWRVSTLIADKVDFRANKTITDRKEYYTMIKRSIPGRHSNPNCVHTKQRGYKIHKTKADWKEK